MLHAARQLPSWLIFDVRPKMKFITILLIVALSCRVYAQDPTAFSFHQTADVVPAKFADRKSGPFALVFVGSPRLKFYPQPALPKGLKGEEATIRAALSVGKDGRVKEVRIIDSTVALQLIQEEASEFLRRVVYQPEVRDKKPIDFETDALLQFKAARKSATNSREYVANANTTYLAETVNRGPRDEKEREIFDKIDDLFKGAPGFRPYKEDIGKRVVLPKLIYAERPAYPAWASQLRISGKVTLAVRVDKDGSIIETKIFDTSDARFNDAAVRAIKKWKFSGGSTEGVPDAFVMVIPIEFTR